MQKKRVLFLASWYPSRENKSLGNFVQRHAEAANQNSEVTVLYAVSSQNSTSIELERNTINGVDTLIVYYPKVKSKLPIIKQTQTKNEYLKALKKGYDFLNKEFDLVHLNETFPAGLFALYLKEKYLLNYVLTVHWTGYLDHTRTFEKLPFYVRSLHKKIFLKASAVLPVSKHLGDSLKKLKLLDDYEVVPNVVNENIFKPKTETSTNASTRFLHVSSFDDEQKNINKMLEAFKNIQDHNVAFFLHLITEGNKEDVWNLIHKIGLEPANCEVEEQATPQEVAEGMRKADCFVLFSNYETFSVVIAEAWMTGIPVIYSRCGGLTEILNPELGVQIERNNLEALTNALENFDSNKFEKSNIVAASKAFSMKVIAKKLTSVYQNVAN